MLTDKFLTFSSGVGGGVSVGGDGGNEGGVFCPTHKEIKLLDNSHCSGHQ